MKFSGRAKIAAAAAAASLSASVAFAAPMTVPMPMGTFVHTAFDGSDNNPDPTFGAAGTSLLRLTTPGYKDGLSEPTGGDPTSLPSARAISNAVSAQTGLIPNSAKLSNMFWQWGQFLDHDIDLSPASGSEAFNISVPTGDPFFDPTSTGTKEIDLTRSDSTTDIGGVRQQTNAITAYIDGSQIYGSSASENAALRLGTGGKLATSTGDLLPKDMAGFFLAGDERANEQVGLTAMHTLWVREHNRVADALIAAKGLDPVADDKLIFDQARAVVVAELQAITYNEWLPLLFGGDPFSPYSYDSSINAGIANEFSTAAFRFGHTMLPPDLPLLDSVLAPVMGGAVALRDAFFNPAFVETVGIDPILRGLTLSGAQNIDTLLIDDVRNFLFGPPGAGGFDLAALNIQRGRDHGLASLNDVRMDLGLTPWVDFLAMTGGDAALAALFASVYASVDDVDLWIGGLAEAEYNGGLLGQTFTMILFDQFSRLKHGDSFWYENFFSRSDIDWLNSLRLADILRLNTGLGDEIQDNVFVYIPGPAPIGLMLLGLGALAAVRRKR